MTFLIIILAIAAIVAIYYLQKSPARNRSVRPLALPRSGVREGHRTSASAEASQASPAPAQGLVMPTDLAAFRFVDRDYLSAERRQALVVNLRGVPHPPPSLHKLVSPELLEVANSNEISDLIMGETLIAAKVLARVNSPFYGLRRPVVNIGQAVTFLGLNGVRSICLQYMLDESFKANSPERRKVFDVVLGASALAGELCFKLCARLELPEQGSLVTQVVLSFLGHLATASLMPYDCILWSPGNGLIERTSAEQVRLGLSASEIGSLLMHEWELPPGLIEDVRDIDRMLVTPTGVIEPNRGVRLALCYLCARLGERLALGSVTDLSTIDLKADSSAELFHLRSHLNSPRLSRLVEFLHSAELVKSIHQMQRAIRTRS